MDNKERLHNATKEFTEALIGQADELRKELSKKLKDEKIPKEERDFLEKGFGSIDGLGEELEKKKKELQQSLKAMQNKFSNF